MQTIYCADKCCKLRTIPFTRQKKMHKKTHKVGMFIHDPVINKVLIVQSEGNLWGLPKGSLEYEENIVNGAIREVMEENWDNS